MCQIAPHGRLSQEWPPELPFGTNSYVKQWQAVELLDTLTTLPRENHSERGKNHPHPLQTAPLGRYNLLVGVIPNIHRSRHCGRAITIWKGHF